MFKLAIFFKFRDVGDRRFAKKEKSLFQESLEIFE